MKKLIFLSFFIFILKAEAQQSIILKSKFLPGYNYDLSIIIKYTMKLDSTLNMPDEGDTEMPRIMASENDFDYTIKTGKISKQKGTPLSLYYANIVSKRLINGKEPTVKPKPNIWINQTVYGVYNDNGIFKLDSVNKKEVTEDTKNSITKFVNSLTGKINFPERRLKPGDSFVQNTPINVTAGSKPILVEFKVNYKLTDIKEDIAYFNYDEIPDTASPSFPKDSTLDPGAHGSGKLEYSIKYNYVTFNSSDLTYSYKIQTEAGPFHNTVKVSNYSRAKITAE